jgi:hypothetical protein
MRETTVESSSIHSLKAGSARVKIKNAPLREHFFCLRRGRDWPSSIPEWGS